MGRGIAEVAIRAGIPTVVREVSQELLDRGMTALTGSLDRGVERGKLEAGERDAALDRLSGGVDLECLAECDLVIEAIVENLDAKQNLFRDLADVALENAIFASNTSSLTLTQMAAASDRPGRFLGLHFFNPVPVMKLVEVVTTMLTHDAPVAEVTAFVDKLGKRPVRASDRSGFIVNRLLVPYLLDAIRAHENGVATIEDIDAGMKLGCGHPMGPFQLMDFIGLDTIYSIANIMFDEFRERRMAPPPMLKQMVQAGRFGRKSGRGFYSYE